MNPNDLTMDFQGDVQYRRFTRRHQRLGTGGELLEEFAVPVVEVVSDPSKPERFIRFYFTPDGVVVSNKEQYF